MALRNQLGLGDDLACDREHRNKRLLEGDLDPAFPVSAGRDELVDQLFELESGEISQIPNEWIGCTHTPSLISVF